MVTKNIGIGLARVTVVAPHSRIDVALPEHAAIAELLPRLLDRAGADLADTGHDHGGWVLRREDGTPLDGDRTLASQNVLDGEVLYLAPYRTDWPEPEFDDLVEAIGAEARRQSPPWTYRATRRFGLGTAAVFPAALLGALLALGPPWRTQALVSLVAAVVLLAGAVLFSRALSDAGAGAVLAAAALPFLGAGAVMIAAGEFGLSEMGAPELLAGCAGVLVGCVAADLGVAHRTPGFAAGAVAALLGAAAAVLCLSGLTPAGAAATVASIVVVFEPGFPLLAMRVGKLPLPSLPTSSQDLLADEPPPPTDRLHARVVRSDQVLTGILYGTRLALLVCVAILALDRDVSASVLVGLITVAALLRARLYPTVRHRLPSLVAGVAGAVALGTATLGLGRTTALALLTAGGLGLAAVSLAAGLVYSRRRPPPSLGRWGDIAEVVSVVSLVPVACAVLGLYGRMRGLAG
jgi:type VII secretion integral membrane protein EccD